LIIKEAIMKEKKAAKAALKKTKKTK